MIFGWIALALALALLGLTVHVWMDLSQKSRRLRAEIDHLQQVVDGHNDELTLVRRRMERQKEETTGLLQERSQLETQVLDQRRAVTNLEERLERARPKSRRVDKSDDDDELF